MSVSQREIVGGVHAGRRLQAETHPTVMAIARTAGSSLLTLFLISLVVFLAMNYHSGDEIARNILGHHVPESEIRAYAAAHHLDEPLLQRYLEWLGGFLSFNWGTVTVGSTGPMVSQITGVPVGPEILQRLQRTLLLAACAWPIGTLVGVGAGAFSARRLGSRIDTGLTLAMVAVYGLPAFIVAIALLLIFSVVFHFVPLASLAFEYGTPADVITALILPAVALAIGMIPRIARITRASARDVTSSAYVQSSTLRGLSSRQILWNHVMRNALGPIANVVGLETIELLSGVVIVENVFSYPGIGQQLLVAIGQGDTVTVETLVMIMGVMFVLVNLVTDLVVLYFNPRRTTFAN